MFTGCLGKRHGYQVSGIATWCLGKRHSYQQTGEEAGRKKEAWLVSWEEAHLLYGVPKHDTPAV